MIGDAGQRRAAGGRPTDPFADPVAAALVEVVAERG
jgi:hypothetical protein